MDYFLFDGRFWQGNGRFAPAMLIRGGRIAAAGDSRELYLRADGCEHISCGGRTVIPGFFDACLCLAAAASPLPEGMAELAGGLQTCMTANRRLAKKGGVLFWKSAGETLDRAGLDAIWPHSPLLLWDVAGNRGRANSAALALLEKHGLPQNLACLMEFDGSGRPTGRLSGRVCRYLAGLLPRPTQGEVKKRLQTALRQAARAGVTSVQSLDLELWLEERDLPVVEQLERETPALPQLQFFSRRFHGLNRRFCGQLTEVGALSRALWQPGQPILPCPDGPALDEILAQLERHPLPAGNFRRLTLLGAACTCPGQLRRMGRQALGVIAFPGRLEQTLTACMGQPGQDSGTCCAFRTLNSLGAHVAFGGLDSLRPWQGIQKAVCREGKEGLTVEAALRCAAEGAAWTGFWEDFTGKLTPGYRADLQVLDGDPFSIPPVGLAGLRPVLVMASGRILHREI